MIKRILLAFDGSDASSKAFDVAAEMAQRYQAQLTVLTVAQTPEIGDEVETEAVIEHSSNYHKRLLHGLKHRGERYGVQPHVEMVVGHPARQILEHADKHQADVIVVGHRGRGALDRWRLGSVAHRIISYADCAVMVVR
jgi:nucleotide-binding universal stress UspA family protein